MGRGFIRLAGARRYWIVGCALLLFISGGGPRVVAAQEPSTVAVVVTVADMQRLFDACDYRGALRLAAEAMSSKAVAPLPDGERYAVLMLRGESLLHLNERAYAIDAWES